MFERFTDRARRVLVLAQEEARLLNHGFIGTEHILLGLVHEGGGVAAKALESLGISLEAVREKVEEAAGKATSGPPESPPFTPRAKKVLELSLREAHQLGHSYIGTEHILLGLVREGEGTGAQVLVSLGADLPRVRQQVIQLMSGYQEAGAAGEVAMAGAPTENRRCFAAAAEGFVELVGEVRPDQWTLPGLGTWDVRSLVGHGARALSTIESYLAQPVSGPALTDPVEYFLAVLGDHDESDHDESDHDESDHDESDERERRDAAIAERGRRHGAELGDDPAGSVRALAGRVLDLVDATTDTALLATPAGAMTLGGYLPTRTFELAVHSLDLARALDIVPPPALAPAVAASCRLAGALGARRRHAADILLLLTGRSPLPAGVSVL